MLQEREINLIPHDVILKEKTADRVWMWSAVGGMLLIVLLGVYGFEQRQISAVEELITDLNSKKLEIEEMINQLNILQERRNRLARKEGVINTLLSKRSISFLFAELERDMNENVWLTSFDFRDDFSVIHSPGTSEDDGQWVETGYFIVKKDRSKTQKNSQNEAPSVTTLLRGIARSNRDLARFLEQLSISEIFSDVNLRYAREATSGEHPMVEFEIETQLKNVRHT